MFYSPFDTCEICRQYVLLDQTQLQCAREHDCHVENCPLARFFAQGDDPPRARDPRAALTA